MATARDPWEPALVLRPTSVLLSVALVPAALVLPVLPAVGQSQAAPHPVAPHVWSLDVAAPTGPTPHGLAAAAVEQPQTTPTFSAFGASWQAQSPSTSKATIQVRVRAEGTGTWSTWTTLKAADSGPDPGSADAVAAAGRVASEPVWAGPSDGVQTRVSGAPVDLRLELVDPGSSAADDATGAQPDATAAAATGQPQVYSRAQWGADESIRLHACPSGPTYSSTIKIGFVHHTVSSNDYSPDQVPAMIRSFYAYHVAGNGWCGIGYNFLVDRFGRIWEGRYGGIDKAVVGSHTGGFNRDSFGVAMIGDFSSDLPGSSMQQAIATLMAWKLGRYYRNPLGADTLTYDGGGYRYCGAKECKAGSLVRLDVISGHRDADAGHTECPGNGGESVLPAIRQGTVAALGGGLVVPAIDTTVHRGGDGGTFTITAGVVTHQSWTLTVTSAAGDLVRTVTGSAEAGGHVSAAWDGRTDAGVPAAAGIYGMRLASAGPTGSAIPFSATVTLLAPVELTGPAQVGYGLPATFTGSTYPGSTVTLLQAPPGSSAFAAVATVGTDADGTFSWSAPATAAESTYAQVGADVSPTTTTLVGPSVSGPALAVPGSQVTLTGTAPPGEVVQVFLQAAGAAPVLTSTLTAAADGSWTTSFTATATYSWYAVAGGLQSPTGVTSIDAPPTIAGPAVAAYNTPVTLTGSAPPGQPLQIWRRERGAAAFTVAASVVADQGGTYTWTYPASDDFRWYASTPGGTSAAGLTLVGVTATGPAAVGEGSRAALHGTALPGTNVAIWHAHRGSTSYVRAGTVTARTDGTWSWPFTATTSWSWYAVSRTSQSAVGATLVTTPPLVSGPVTTTVGATVHVTGRATAGDTVTLWLHRRGSAAYRAAGSAIATGDGRWALSFVATEDYRWYVTSVTGRSRTLTTTIRVVAAAVPHARRGAMVALHGSAVPGQLVRVWFRTGAHWLLGRTLRADAAGRWRTTFRLDKPVSWYAQSRGVRSGVGRTTPG